jgi:tetratricopeptide (TPR) repeat protein
MRWKGLLVGLFMVGVVSLGSSVLHAAGVLDSLPPNYPDSLKTDLQRLLSTAGGGQASTDLYLALAQVYMDLADDLFTDNGDRRSAYEEGAKAAERAMELQDSSAQAHFLYAANLGSAERIKGLTYAAMRVKEIKQHVARAIELDPTHAQALQMMGGLLMELPWFLGGDKKHAQGYLERAVAADGNFTNARILLAKLYKNQNRIDEAKEQLKAVIHAEHPHYPYAWARKFKPEAERMLQELPPSGPAAQ